MRIEHKYNPGIHDHFHFDFGLAYYYKYGINKGSGDTRYKLSIWVTIGKHFYWIGI